MNYLSLSKIIIKAWLNTEEIMLIANCGRNSAIKIRKQIENEIIKEGNILPKSSPLIVPTKRVLEGLGLDEVYIFEMAEKEKKINVGGKEYASI